MGFSTAFGCAVLASLLMIAIWQAFDPRVIYFFVFFMVISEFFLQTRWRISIVCNNCGFDPLTYVKNPELAAQKVKSYLEERRQDPKFIRTRPLDLPVIRRSTADRLPSNLASK